MRKTSSVNVLWLLISLVTIGLMACKSSNKNGNKTESTMQEMPAPASDNNIDSLKKVQQLKRDSIQRNR
jgi:hypothetical protein